MLMHNPVDVLEHASFALFGDLTLQAGKAGFSGENLLLDVLGNVEEISHAMRFDVCTQRTLAHEFVIARVESAQPMDGIGEIAIRSGALVPERTCLILSLIHI